MVSGSSCSSSLECITGRLVRIVGANFLVCALPSECVLGRGGSLLKPWKDVDLVFGGCDFTHFTLLFRPRTALFEWVFLTHADTVSNLVTAVRVLSRPLLFGGSSGISISGR